LRGLVVHRTTAPATDKARVASVTAAPHIETKTQVLRTLVEFGRSAGFG
jgi:hypothetical protein